MSAGEGSAGGSFVHDEGVISGEPVKRKRGRPRKHKPVLKEPMKRKIGRPRKYRAGEVPLKGPKKPRSYATNTRRALLANRVCTSEDRENAHDRAEELQSALDPDIPSFVKPILQSHVTSEFWLDLPVEFCKTYLPERDETITMVNETGDVFLAKYLALKTGLIAGWRGFAIQHNLADGDALVFQMITSTRFNVYIIKSD